MSLLKGSIVLKMSALAVAMITYFYIHNEIDDREKEIANDPSYKLLKLTAKNLPVKVRFDTQPPDGYRIVEEGVSAKPVQVMVVGPEALLDDALTAETSIVDVSESTKNFTRKIPLESVAGVHLTGTPYLVDVVVPIEKIVSEDDQKKSK